MLASLAYEVRASRLIYARTRTRRCIPASALHCSTFDIPRLPKQCILRNPSMPSHIKFLHVCGLLARHVTNDGFLKPAASLPQQHHVSCRCQDVSYWPQNISCWRRLVGLVLHVLSGCTAVEANFNATSVTLHKTSVWT